MDEDLANVQLRALSERANTSIERLDNGSLVIRNAQTGMEIARVNLAADGRHYSVETLNCYLSTTVLRMLAEDLLAVRTLLGVGPCAH